MQRRLKSEQILETFFFPSYIKSLKQVLKEGRGLRQDTGKKNPIHIGWGMQALSLGALIAGRPISRRRLAYPTGRFPDSRLWIGAFPSVYRTVTCRSKNADYSGASVADFHRLPISLTLVSYSF